MARVQSVFPGEGQEDLPYAFNISAYDAAGAWTATAVDVARLVGRLNPARPGPVLNAGSFAEMIRRPPAPVSQAGNSWYGIGINVVDQGNGNYFLSHAGSLPGTNSLVMRYHPLDLTIVVIFNQRGTAGHVNIAISATTSSLAAAATSYVRSGRPWPAHDLFGLYFAGDRPRTSAAATLSAASFKGGAVAPGQIVTLFGERLGGDQLTTARVADGRLASELNGTRVLFDGAPAPLVLHRRPPCRRRWNGSACAANPCPSTWLRPLPRSSRPTPPDPVRQRRRSSPKLVLPSSTPPARA